MPVTNGAVSTACDDRSILSKTNVSIVRVASSGVQIAQIAQIVQIVQIVQSAQSAQSTQSAQSAQSARAPSNSVGFGTRSHCFESYVRNSLAQALEHPCPLVVP
jgi:hypothetical protein